MWDPSGSASALIMILSYLDLLASQFAPIPQPIEFAISQIYLFLMISFKSLNVVFRILPRIGNTACVTLSLTN